MTNPTTQTGESKSQYNVGDKVKKDEGWGYPVNSNKAHYFVNGRSLCMRWAFFSPNIEPQVKPYEQQKDDCRECGKRLVKWKTN